MQITAHARRLKKFHERDNPPQIQAWRALQNPYCTTRNSGGA